MLRNFVKGPGFLGGSGTCSAELVAVVGDDRGSAAGLGFGGVGAGFGFGGGGAGLGPFFLPLLSSTSAEIVPVLPAEKLITLAPKVFTAMAAASGPPSCCTITPHATASRASTARARAVNESFGRRFVTAKGGTGDPTRTLLEPTSLMGALIAPFKCVVPRDGDGEAAGAIGCDFLGLRFDGEEFFCCDGLRRAGELACRGGIFCWRPFRFLVSCARFLFLLRRKRSVVTVHVFGHSHETVKNKRADTGSKEPAILSCLVRVTGVLAWEATPRTVCVTRVSRVNVYATHASTGATALCPVCVQARRFEPAGRNWVSPNIASRPRRRNAARP